MLPCPAGRARGKIGRGNPFGLGVMFLNVLLRSARPARAGACRPWSSPAPWRPTAACRPGAVFGLAVAACLIGDSTWYVAGRLFGGRVMKLLCRISLTPDTCVSQTQTSFERWGAKVLIVAKFIPGLSLVAPPLAGPRAWARRASLRYSFLGAALWVGAALLGGRAAAGRRSSSCCRTLAGLGGAAIAVVLLLVLAGYIAYKWWQRWRFYAALDMARISVDELYAQHEQAGAAPVVLDVRSADRAGPGAAAHPRRTARAGAAGGRSTWQAAARPRHHPVLHLPERGLRRAGGAAAHGPRLPPRTAAARRAGRLDRRRLRGRGIPAPAAPPPPQPAPARCLARSVGLQPVDVELAGHRWSSRTRRRCCCRACRRTPCRSPPWAR